MPPRPRKADVQEPPFLLHRLGGLRLPCGQLLLLQAGKNDRVELEPLRAVVGQQVYAACVPLPGETGAEIDEEIRDRARAAELLGQTDEPRQVGLASRLLLAD